MSSENRTGTDFPAYLDERDGVMYSASWDSSYGFPFGFFYDKFYIGGAYTMHTECARLGLIDHIRSFIEEDYGPYWEDARNLEAELDDLAELNYTYNEVDDEWVDKDGRSLSFEEIVDEILEDMYNMSYTCAKGYVESVLNGGEIPDYSAILEDMEEYIISDNNLDEEGISREDLNMAVETILGRNFDEWFEDEGCLRGRIYPNDSIISFYESEQPDSNELGEIVQLLSQSNIGLSYDEIMNFEIIYADFDDNYKPYGCKVHEYISRTFGKDEPQKNDDRQWRRGTTKFIPHLASPEQKKEYFKDFIKNRDEGIYVPMERAAGNIARYRAMRYPYGESKTIDSNKVKKILREQIESFTKHCTKF